MHLHHCRCFYEHVRMLLQSLRALSNAPGGAGSSWKYLEALARATVVSGRFAYGFPTALHFADEALVRSPTVLRQRHPFLQCPHSCGGTSTHHCACILLGLPLGRHLSSIHLSTSSRLPLRLLSLPLLPSAKWHFWLWWRHPV